MAPLVDWEVLERLMMYWLRVLAVVEGRVNEEDDVLVVRGK